MNSTYPSHNGTEEKKQTLPVPGDIGLWKLDADGKHADSEDDTRKLEGDGIRRFFITVGPTARIEHASTIGSWVGG